MAQSAGKVMLRPRGEYDAAVTYDILDIVIFDGSSFVAKKSTLGNEPEDGEFWQLLASGATGGAGASYGNSNTESETADKIVTTTDGKFKLKTGASVFVNFENEDTAGNCTLDVDSTGVKPILSNGVSIPAKTLTNTTIFEFVYDGTSYNLIGTVGGLKAEEMSQEEYDALSDDEKNRGDKLYAVNSESGAYPNTALGTSYNNTKSGLDALNVQNAVDEVVEKLENVPTSAETTTYDNATSGLTGENVQDALDEVSAGSNTLDFETGDTTDDTATEWKEVEKIEKTNPLILIITKVSSAVNNIRYLFDFGTGQYLRLHDLGTAYTSELKEDIRSGKFKKAHVGGYLTINGHMYYFAHPDYWLHTGDTECTIHHMLVIPASNLLSGKMNSTNITTGAYIGSDMYTGNNSNTALAEAKAIIKADFGTANILTHRELFANTVADGKASNWSLYDSDIDLMNEVMVYGTTVGSKPVDGSINFDVGIDKTQILLFQLRPDLITTRATWWLRSVVSASDFACVAYGGYAYYYGASGSLGVRPAFAIC